MNKRWTYKKVEFLTRTIILKINIDRYKKTLLKLKNLKLAKAKLRKENVY